MNPYRRLSISLVNMHLICYTTCMIIFIIFAIYIGACVGSFLNVVILRLPANASLWRRSSHCMHCDRSIPPWWNIPILSYILLRGKCRYCRTPLTSQYVVVEILTATFFAVSFYVRWHDVVPLIMTGQVHQWAQVASALYPWIADCALWSVLCAMTFIDARYFIIPLELTITGACIGAFLTVIYPPLRGAETISASLLSAVVSVAVGGGLFYAVRCLGGWLMKREALGLGDVHLMIMFGFYFTWQQQLLIVFLSACVGSIAGILTKLLLRRAHWRFEIPYGPYLAAAALVTHFWGDALIAAYMSLYAAPL